MSQEHREEAELEGIKGEYTASELFENWSGSFSAYEIYMHEDGTEDLKILAANRAFVDLIGEDYDTIAGKLFTDTCTMALDWLPLYIETAKTGAGNMHESYNQDLKKYLSAVVFSPKAGQVAIVIIDRTDIWSGDQALRAREKDLAALFSSMTTGFCMGRVIRDEQGRPVDVLLELVNAAFELLEGFATASLQGKRLLEVSKDDAYFEKYVDVVDHKSKITFQKHITRNDFILEVICFSQIDDMFVCIESNISERVKAEQALQMAYVTIEEQNMTILSGIDYASKIQRNLLPRESLFGEVFLDYSVMWRPRDIVGGDIYWLKKFDAGSLLCVCDCTGHGTPGALLTMLVVSALETAVNEHNCQDTAEVVHLLDESLAHTLNVDVSKQTNRQGKSMLDFSDGCDMAVLFAAKDGSVVISSANTNVFICDGEKVQRVKGQRLHVGEGRIESREAVKTVTIPSDPNYIFYIASDGLYDQIGQQTGRPFGYQVFTQLILEHHKEKQAVISDKVWKVFEAYRGSQPRRDDVELISFRM